MPQSRRKLVAVFVATVFVGIASLAGEKPLEVVIRGYKFEPAKLEIKVGQTVRWTNDEKRTSHSVFFNGPDGLESERLFPGESWQRTFDKPGTYLYTCGPHPEMTGKVVVNE